MIGSSSGRFTWKNRRQKPAPSTIAASLISCGIEDIPARVMTVANGNMRQTCTVMIAIVASVGSPNQ